MSVKPITFVLCVIVCSVGIATAQTEWEQHPSNPVLEPGLPGEWDDEARSATTVFFDGSTYHMWFYGFGSNQAESAIGHATSPDGVDWTMDPLNPVLTAGAPGDWDEDGLVGSAVIHDGALFHLWYGGVGGGVTRVGYATSPDGSIWTKYPGNPVMDVGGSGSGYAVMVRPGTVIVEDDVYRMWFTASAGDWLLWVGYAESTDDGITWTARNPVWVLRAGSDPGAWDGTAVANPYVIFDGSTYHMWFAGALNGLPAATASIGYAFSNNGIEWTKHRDNPVVQSTGGWAYQPAVSFDGSIYHMWYTHGPNPGSPDPRDVVSYATSGCCGGIFACGFECGETTAWSAAVP